MGSTFLKQFGLSIPIVQAPMAGAQGSALAIAVSNAGGLGSLPTAMFGVDALRGELKSVRAGTNRAFNVNCFCHAAPVADAARESAWRGQLAQYYREFAIDPASIPEGGGRRPFDAAMADLLAEFAPPIVSFHFGLPSPDLVARVKQWGASVWSSATTADEARWLEDHGADVVIAQGVEAGGHRGMFLSSDITTQIGTFALLPQVVQAVKVPVVAAGGIADAKGVAAVLALGAAAAQVGSAYLLCPESSIGAVHRAALKSDAARHTALTNVFIGRPARGIVNRIVREQGPMSTSAPAFPLAGAALAPIRAKAEAQSSGDFSPLWCGQNPTGFREIPAADLTRELAAGAV